MISLNIWISIANEIPTLTVKISVKPDPYSASLKNIPLGAARPVGHLPWAQSPIDVILTNSSCHV